MDQDHWIPRLVAGMPWWVKWAFMGGVGVLSAFLPGIIAPQLQMLGAFFGGALILVSIAGAATHTINQYRVKRGRPRLKLEPIYLIIFGLAIAMTGVGWHFFYRGSATPSVTTPPTIAASPDHPPPPVAYTLYELQRRQRAYDEILNILNGPMREVQSQAQSVHNAAMQQLEKNGPSGLSNMLKDFKSASSPVFDGLARKVDEYKEYLGDISLWRNNNLIPKTDEFIDFLNAADPNLNISDVMIKRLPQKMWSTWSASATTGLKEWLDGRRQFLADQREKDAKVEVLK